VLHPDKGGDVAAFRALQEAWETLRGLVDSGRLSAAGFGHYLGGAGSSVRLLVGFAFRAVAVTASFCAFPCQVAATPLSSSFGRSPQSWEWFAEADSEDVPPYCCEPGALESI
jgi:hypothetical protein